MSAMEPMFVSRPARDLFNTPMKLSSIIRSVYVTYVLGKSRFNNILNTDIN